MVWRRSTSPMRKYVVDQGVGPSNAASRLQGGQVDLAHVQELLARGGVGHELGDVVGDDLPGDAPAVDAPAAALGLGHG